MAETNIVSPAISQSYMLSASGGNDKGSYYASVAYNNDNGSAPNNFYNRLSFTFNGDYKIKKWLKSSSGVKLSHVDWNGLPAGWNDNEDLYFSRALAHPPTLRKTDHEGNYVLGRDYKDGNQLVNLDAFVRDNNRVKVDLNQAFDISLYDGLKLTLSANWMYDYQLTELFNKDFLKSAGNIDTKHINRNTLNQYLTQTYNAVLNYNKSFKLHSLDATAGFEFYDRAIVGFSAEGSGSITDDFSDLENTSTDEGMRKIDSWHTRERIVSAFARVNYDYKSKYLASFVLRSDGYSKLIGDNQFGFFPGASLGWLLSKEDFMSSISDVVSFAKIRTSYGLNGNVSGVGLYELQGSYESIYYDGDLGYSLKDFPNPYLRWEKSHTFDVGLDISFLNNRINANFTYYNRLTKDKFANVSLPSSSGLNSIRTNNGALKNQGVEMDFNFRVYDKNDWNINVGLNAAYNQNMVVQLPENGLDNNRQDAIQVYVPGVNGSVETMWVGGKQEGQVLGDFYGFQANGIYQTYDDIPGDLVDNTGAKTLYGPDAWALLSNAEKKEGLPIQPGDVIWHDVNGDGVIDNYDKVKLGNRVPKWTGGATINVGWKGLSLGVRMDYALGFQVYDQKTPWLMGAMQGQYNTLEAVKDTWTPENPNAQYPKFYRADQNGKRNYSRTSSMFTYNSSYLALREVSLSYSLPRNIAKKMCMQDLSISLTGQNLGYLTAAKDVYSPEYSNGDSTGGYPLPITCVFGLDIVF